MVSLWSFHTSLRSTGFYAQKILNRLCEEAVEEQGKIFSSSSPIALTQPTHQSKGSQPPGGIHFWVKK